MNIEENSEDEISITDEYSSVRDELEQYFQMNSAELNISPPRETMEFVYPGLNSLKTDNIKDILSCYETANVNLCTYQVNTSGDKPFLQFVLRKYDKSHESKADFITFPSFKCRREDHAEDTCELIENVICITYRIGLDSYEYKGFINDESEFYVFYELKNNSIDIHDLYRANDLWLVLVDEILNKHSVCNFAIDAKVSQFFSNNIDFAYLKDSHDNYYETPTVAYTGSVSKKLNWISCFGVSKTEEECANESYYYFTDYINAMRMGGWNEDKITRGGLVRFAIFLGYTKVFINNDVVDCNNCDSVYIGNSPKSPLWGLKEYGQQLPLTCHYIDKSTLGDEWGVNETYYII
jgi:hypothetical protein